MLRPIPLISLLLALTLISTPTDAISLTKRIQHSRRQPMRSMEIDEPVAASLLSSSSSPASSLIESTSSSTTRISPAFFHDSANGAGFLRSPYLPATLSGPIYPRSGPTSGAAKEWMKKAGQPAHAAFPYGRRTPAPTYVLPFDHMREVHDEFTFNYDTARPASPQRFTLAAPIFIEENERQQQGETTEQEEESEQDQEEADGMVDGSLEEEAASKEDDSLLDLSTDASVATVEYVRAIEVDDLTSALDANSDINIPGEDATLLESSSQQAPAGGDYNSYWSSRGEPGTTSFHSYSNPYFDLTHPSLHGTFADLQIQQQQQHLQRQQVHHAISSSPSTRGPVRSQAYAYHRGSIPPFAHQIEPYLHLTPTPPREAQVGENSIDTFLTDA